MLIERSCEDPDPELCLAKLETAQKCDESVESEAVRSLLSPGLEHPTQPHPVRGDSYLGDLTSNVRNVMVETQASGHLHPPVGDLDIAVVRSGSHQIRNKKSGPSAGLTELVVL